MKSDVISGLKILHVSTMAEVLVHFKLPLLEMLSNAGAIQSVYCSDEQYCGSKDDSYKEGGHLRILLDLGYRVNVGQITRRPSIRTLFEIWVLSRHIRESGYDLVIAHQPVAALVGITAAKLAGARSKIYFSGGLRVVTLADRLINKYGEHLMVLLSDATMLNNHEDYDYVRGLWGGSGKARFAGAIEGCGIDTDEFSLSGRLAVRRDIRKQLSIEDREVIICFAGRLVWEKGIEELISAVSILEKTLPGFCVRCLVVGVGPDMDEIRGRVEKAGLARKFILTGYRFDIQRHLAACDIFVLPSYREGLPTTLLQAMAMGLPCVATNIRGSRELIHDGYNGLIVSTHDSGALAGALASLVNNPVMAENMGMHARKSVLEKYSRDILLPRTMDTIRDVLKGINS